MVYKSLIIWGGLVWYAGLARRPGPIFLFDYMSRAGKEKSCEIRNKMAKQHVNKKKLILIALL